ncbi:MAG: translation initiation factor IF-2 [Ruminococcaceae bacterium]|nr:translation initiation factor IF-2 [Oscillospiraceae bacterium]
MALTQYKVNQLAKDLGLKTKDIVELMSSTGIEVKTQKTLLPEEFDVFLNLVTKANQIVNIDEYLDGVTYIPSKVKAEEQEPEPKVEPKVEEKKPEPKVESKVEEKKPEPKVEPKVEEKKPEPKAEAKPAPAAKPAFEPRRQEPQGRPAQGAYPQKPAQPVGYNNQKTQQQKPQGANQGFGGQKPFRDKDEMGSQRAPREKFQPKAIVREQTPKGTVSTQKHGATRVVDTRGTTVDLSKYDERLDNFVPDSVRDARGGMGKVKKNVGGNRAPINKDIGGNRAPMANKNKGGKKAPQQPVKKQQLRIQVPDEISVGELASRLQAKAGDVVKRLMLMGVMASVNQTIDYDTAYLIADEMGAICEKEVIVTIEDKLFDEKEDSAEDLVERAPVVCVMGHVDHGKTSLLDAIRNTHVTSGEAGGITQHIGAYRVSLGDKEITFLDTPGHEAFTAMRARGAMATDIAILVVAADDGIMPQTIEAINHAKMANVQIIVAINKMDKPTANPDAIKQELTKYDLVPEEWGGDVMCVPVSALTHFGIDDLLERVLLIAEVQEYKANPNRRAKGIVIESKLDRGRGPVATILVQNGTLRNGDIVIAGTAVGRVRSMTDHTGKPQKVAGPSVPVEITGLADVPEAGDEFIAVDNERMARELADQRRAKAKEDEFKANSRANLNDLFAQIAEGVKDLNIIVKADVAGSVEAVKQSLEKISNDEVKVKVIHAATGGIKENDVMLAAASNAIIVGFNVRPDKTAIDSAERQNVEIRTYRVIYECIEEITAAMKGMLAPKYREAINGHAEVRQTIHVPNVGTIAGSYVQDGKIGRNNLIRVLRDGVVIFEDKIGSLRRFKDDVKEVAQGYECGVGLEKFNDIKVGDVLEAYYMEEIEQ